MNKQDLLSVGITAFAGFIAGMYLYVIGFAGLVQNFQLGTEVDYDLLTVQGEKYGSCGDRCDSFQLLNDGTYRFIDYTSTAENSVLKQGTIPRGLQREVGQALSDRRLMEESKTIERPNCPSDDGGLDVRYEITYRGTDYMLDSCTTAVDGQGELWQALLEVWGHFDEIGNS